jgi:hypothetical protein
MPRIAMMARTAARALITILARRHASFIFG